MIGVWLFWVALILVAYTYVGFPFLLALRARFCPKAYWTARITPSVSVLICAHDEADCIADKLENIASLDYPRDCLELVVASDGSTDGTDEIVRQHVGPGVELLSLPRAGKIAALNAAASGARGEILVFTDANSRFERGALRALVAPFADPQVGGVAGDQRYLHAPDTGVSAGERGYWNLDRQIKKWQSRAGSVTSATGAIHALRRELFQPVPSGVTDDFFVSTLAIKAGRRLVFAPDAVAWERTSPEATLEFGRKKRIASRGLRGVIAVRELLDPRRTGFYALQLSTHKLLRRLLVFPLIALFASSLVLWWHGPIYRAAAAGQLGLYAGALLGWLLGSRVRLPRPLVLAQYFVLANAACLVAAANLVRRRRIDVWETQPRRNPGGLGA